MKVCTVGVFSSFRSAVLNLMIQKDSVPSSSINQSQSASQSVSQPINQIQGGPKKVSQRSLHITSSNTVRFSKFFHCYILPEICNKAAIKYSTSPQTCCHTTLCNTYVSKLVRPQSVKCVTSFRFTKLKYNEYF